MAEAIALRMIEQRGASLNEVRGFLGLPELEKKGSGKKAPEKKKVVKKTPEKKEPEKKTPEKEEKTAKTETTPEKTPEKTVSVDTVKKTPTIEKKPEIKKNTGLGNLFGDSKPKKKDDKKKLETYFNK